MKGNKTIKYSILRYRKNDIYKSYYGNVIVKKGKPVPEGYGEKISKNGIIYNGLWNNDRLIFGYKYSNNIKQYIYNNKITNNLYNKIHIDNICNKIIEFHN